MHIDWHLSKGNGEQRSGVATIAVYHLSMIDLAVPSVDATMQQPDPYMTGPTELELTHLEIIPRFADPKNPPYPPLIVAIFVPVLGLLEGNDMRRAPFSILSRWEIHREKPEIDPIFSQIGSKRLNTDNLKVWHVQACAFFCLRLTGRISVETA